MVIWKLTASLMFCAIFASTAFADDEALENHDGPIIEAIRNTKPILDVRYRFERKEQDGFAVNAVANTLRTRLGFETGEFYDFKILVELENVFSMANNRFNSTTNGQTQFPVIADPNTTELNRAQVTFTGIKETAITVGRQRYNLNNHRFIGAVDFRQNQQTFDAVLLSSTIIDNLSIDYLYIDRVHRIFGDGNPLGEFDSDSHVVSAAYSAGKLGTVKVYGILLDLMEAPALSSATWGLRYENAVFLDEESGIKLGFVAEFASQRDFAANPFDYSETYVHGEATLSVTPFTGKIGYERLSGNGAIGFSTPLATLHKFQGFADVFLTTPSLGVEDFYGTLSYAWKKAPFGSAITFYATYHDFEAEQGSVDFGNEVDAGINFKFSKQWSAEVKFAVYDGASAFADRNIIWTALRFKY